MKDKSPVIRKAGRLLKNADGRPCFQVLRLGIDDRRIEPVIVQNAFPVAAPRKREQDLLFQRGNGSGPARTVCGQHFAAMPDASRTDNSLRFFGKENQRLYMADDYERSQNSPFSKGVTMKGLVALYLYIIARKIADRKVFPYGRQLLFPGDCYALDYAYFEVEIQGISISHNHVFDDGTEYLSVVLVQTPHIT